jgi:hypothetical protein
LLGGSLAILRFIRSLKRDGDGQALETLDRRHIHVRGVPQAARRMKVARDGLPANHVSVFSASLSDAARVLTCLKVGEVERHAGHYVGRVFRAQCPIDKFGDGITYAVKAAPIAANTNSIPCQF